jgi:hypothetical protein
LIRVDICQPHALSGVVHQLIGTLYCPVAQLIIVSVSFLYNTCKFIREDPRQTRQAKRVPGSTNSSEVHHIRFLQCINSLVRCPQERYLKTVRRGTLDRAGRDRQPCAEKTLVSRRRSGAYALHWTPPPIRRGPARCGAHDDGDPIRSEGNTEHVVSRKSLRMWQELTSHHGDR